MHIFTVLLITFILSAVPYAHSAETLTGADAFGNWESNKPGVRRHIQASDLPAPENGDDPEEPDFEMPPDVVEAPDGATPQVPDGFEVEVFATGLDEPRVVRIAPNGDVFVAESAAGRVLIFPGDSAGRAPVKPEVFAEGLEQPYGIAFHPPKEPEYVYVGEANQVVRFPYRSGDRKAIGPARVIVPDIPTERHWTRDLAASHDGEHLFLAVGSASNVAAEMPEKAPVEIQEYEELHGVGAAWGAEEERAVVRVFDPEGTTIRNYATGLRNCSGMAIHTSTDTLWCVVNERDHLGANVPPDMVVRVQEGGFYGWPWYYAGGNEDPAHKGERPDLKEKVIEPDVLLQAHSSTMNLTFYEPEAYETGAFPAEYEGDAFAAMHGSWNREERTGYKVVRIPMEDGEPTGVYEDFMTGFVLDDDTVWARPVGVAFMKDGTLLVSDDANGTLFRVTYTKAE